MNLNALHLILTYRCLNECDHCARFCGPRARQVMTRSQIRRYVDQAAELGSIQWIFFEGGEPTLFWPLVAEGIRHARSRGLNTALVTSGYWITSLKDLVLYVRELRSHGLDLLQVSVDALHDNLRLEHLQQDIVDLARKANMSCQFLSVSVPPADAEPVGARRGAMITGGHVEFRGRAAHRLVAEQALWEWDSFDECPHERLDDPYRIHVDPYGHVHVCDGILIGNLERRNLASVMDSYRPREHPIVGPLLEGGPAQLVRHHRLPHAKGYADACHICYGARRRLREQFPELLGPSQVYGESGGRRGAGQGNARSGRGTPGRDRTASRPTQ